MRVETLKQCGAAALPRVYLTSFTRCVFCCTLLSLCALLFIAPQHTCARRTFPTIRKLSKFYWKHKEFYPFASWLLLCPGSGLQSKCVACGLLPLRPVFMIFHLWLSQTICAIFHPSSFIRYK